MEFYKHRTTFHNYRYKPETYSSVGQRLWHFHDQHPLPPFVNRRLREVMRQYRRLRTVVLAPTVRGERDEFGDVLAPRQTFLAPCTDFVPPSLEKVEARFRDLHQLNEYLYNGDGSWEQHVYSSAYGSGVAIEEVAFRIQGYLAAYEIFGDPIYHQRAVEGGEYILRERLFADGHLRLESHMVTELEYTFAGCGLLALHQNDPVRTDWLDAARRIGDRLVEEHCTGCSDHATMPAQLLGPLYQLTGDASYLKAALQRVFRYAVDLQLPYGGWTGPDSFIWYHSIITKSVLSAYVATPNTLAYYAKKDRLARCLTAGINRLLAAQDETGQIKMGRGEQTWDYSYADHMVTFEDGNLVHAPFELHRYTGPYELDLLMAAFERLAVQPAAVAAMGYAELMLQQTEYGRADFETFAMGRCAQFLSRLARGSKQTQREVGFLADR